MPPRLPLLLTFGNAFMRGILFGRLRHRDRAQQGYREDRFHVAVLSPTLRLARAGLSRQWFTIACQAALSDWAWETRLLIVACGGKLLFWIPLGPTRL